MEKGGFDMTDGGGAVGLEVQTEHGAQWEHLNAEFVVGGEAAIGGVEKRERDAEGAPTQIERVFVGTADNGERFES